jgi:hypothetical protein
MLTSQTPLSGIHGLVCLNYEASADGLLLVVHPTLQFGVTADTEIRPTIVGACVTADRNLIPLLI